LVKSDYFASDPKKIIRVITHGLSGPITVNGKLYDGVMPKQSLSDNQVASVVTYILNNFGNKGGEVDAEDVARSRK
jgi:nitrite reductase (NO-forming)